MSVLLEIDDGVVLCADTFGDPSDPAVLLIHGATASMDWWDPGLCQSIAAAGRHVIRYDHRDTGESTQWPAGHPSYDGGELGRDPLRLLDALGVGAAHLVGVSMGGGISQDLAVQHPDRVLSLTLVATTCAFERAEDTPLPGPEARLREGETAEDLDWSDQDAVVEEMVRVQRVFAGSLFDEQATRAVARQVVARTPDVRAMVTNHWAVIGGEDGPPRRMADISKPTLVVHGAEDPMFPLPHGEALEREISGAGLLVVPGMGHEAPPPASHDDVVPALISHTG